MVTIKHLIEQNNGGQSHASHQAAKPDPPVLIFKAV